VWFFWDDPRLRKAARALIEDAGNRKLVSIASCWEIAIKVGLVRLDLGEPSQLLIGSRSNPVSRAFLSDRETSCRACFRSPGFGCRAPHWGWDKGCLPIGRHDRGAPAGCDREPVVRPGNCCRTKRKPVRAQ
jgi:hypothetical protein